MGGKDDGSVPTRDRRFPPPPTALGVACAEQAGEGRPLTMRTPPEVGRDSSAGAISVRTVEKRVDSIGMRRVAGAGGRRWPFPRTEAADQAEPRARAVARGGGKVAAGSTGSAATVCPPLLIKTD